MKRTISMLCVALILMLSVACGDGRTINGEYHDTYGLFSQNEKDPDVCYTTIAGNVVWAIILVETIVAPVYFIGFSLYEPNDDKYCKFTQVY